MDQGLCVHHFNCAQVLVSPSPIPPATTRDLPLHTIAVNQCLVGMGGNRSVHSLSVRLRSELRINYTLGVIPPTAVRRLLTIARLKS